MLEVYTPEVTKAYITSRLDSVVTVLREGQEDPLDDTAIVLQQLDQVSLISACSDETDGSVFFSECFMELQCLLT